MLGPVDVGQLPFRERQPDPVGPAELLGEHEARDALDRGQMSDQRGFAEAALQHRAPSVGERHIHVPAREPGLQPVQYGHRGADELTVQIEILAEGQLAAFRCEPQGPGTLPRIQDRTPDGPLDRPLTEELLTGACGTDALSRQPHPNHFPHGCMPRWPPVRRSSCPV